MNPYDIESTAAAIASAFAMPLDERKDRWHAMMAVLRDNSVHDWASHFLQALAHEAEETEFDEPLRQAVLLIRQNIDGIESRSQMNSTRADA